MNLQLPFEKAVHLASQDLFPANDTDLIAGIWQFRNDGGAVQLEVFNGTPDENGLTGTLDYLGQYQCHAGLHLLGRNGHSFNVSVQDAAGAACPGFQSETWISAMNMNDPKDKYTFIDANFPTPVAGQFGISMCGNHLSKGYRYVGPAGERPAASQETTPAANSVLTSTNNVPTTDVSANTTPPAPETTQAPPATPPGSSGLQLVRPTSDPVSAGLPRLYDTATTLDGGAGKACALIDPGNPVKQCTVSVSISGQYTWSSAWCSSTPAAVVQKLNHATFSYDLNGRPINSSYFWEGRTHMCLKRCLII